MQENRRKIGRKFCKRKDWRRKGETDKSKKSNKGKIIERDNSED